MVSSRLVTLTGAGGSGKTRLALQVASRTLEKFQGGTWFVDLSTRTAPSDPLVTLASSLDLREEPGQDLLGRVIERVQEKALLLLDNCEHLIRPCAELADTLLRACPRLTIMATSRQPFDIDGEIIWRVPPLSLPDLNRLPGHEQLTSFEAVQLFIERARAKRNDFALTADNAQAVAELCVYLDGLPLAIELAAARVRVLSIEQIVERLSERFQLLTSNNQTAPFRQQTLQALIDWSYDLLDRDEQDLLLCLSTFRGRFTMEAAQAVTDNPHAGVVGLLANLVDKSLVNMETRKGKAYYSLLETIRQYAELKAEAQGKSTALAARHLAYYLGIATSAESTLQGDTQAATVELLGDNYENILAALDWAVRANEGTEAALQMVWALGWFWVMRGILTRGRELTMKAVERGRTAEPTEALAKALLAASRLAIVQGDNDAARAGYEDSLAAFRKLNDEVGIITSLIGLAHVDIRERRYPEAASLFTEALERARAIGDDRLIALSLFGLGHRTFYMGEFGRAETLLTEARTIFLRLGNRSDAAYAAYDLGRIALERGRHQEATELLTESLDMLVRLGNKPGVANAINGLAQAAVQLGDYMRAAGLYGASRAILDEMESTLNASERERYRRNREQAYAAIGKQVWDAAVEQAQHLSFEEAVQLARAGRYHARDESEPVRPPQTERTPPAAYPAGLTVREVQVLRLVSQGLTDAQVGTQLEISTRTVEAHLRKIYRKLQVTTRRAAAQFARTHHLV